MPSAAQEAKKPASEKLMPAPAASPSSLPVRPSMVAASCRVMEP